MLEILLKCTADRVQKTLVMRICKHSHLQSKHAYTVWHLEPRTD